MKWLAALFFVSVLCYFSGCDINGKHGNGGGDLSRFDRSVENELHQSLENFEEFFSNTIIDSSDELDRLSPVARSNRSTLKLRSVTIKASGAMLGQDDPLTALIDVWVLSVRLREYFEDGLGSTSFEPNQEVLIEAFDKIHRQVENIGLEYLTKEQFEMARHKVYEFAKANPVRAGLKETVLFATETYEGQGNPFEEIVAFPLIPITTMVNGMAAAGTGPGKISASVDNFADTIEAFPESARWQLLMLLYDIEKLDSVKSTVESLSEFSKSTSRLADSAEKLPEGFRAEFSNLLVEIEKMSPNIRKMTESAEATSDNIKEAIEGGGELAVSLTKMCEKIELAAGAWQGAADSTGTAVSRMIELRQAGDLSDEVNPYFNVYMETARELSSVADKLPGVLLGVDTLTKKLTQRIASLIALFFAVMLAYTVVLLRLRKNGKTKSV